MNASPHQRLGVLDRGRQIDRLVGVEFRRRGREDAAPSYFHRKRSFQPSGSTLTAVGQRRLRFVGHAQFFEALGQPLQKCYRLGRAGALQHLDGTNHAHLVQVDEVALLLLHQLGDTLAHLGGFGRLQGAAQPGQSGSPEGFEVCHRLLTHVKVVSVEVADQRLNPLRRRPVARQALVDERHRQLRRPGQRQYGLVTLDGFGVGQAVPKLGQRVRLQFPRRRPSFVAPGLHVPDDGRRVRPGREQTGPVRREVERRDPAAMPGESAEHLTGRRRHDVHGPVRHSHGQQRPVAGERALCGSTLWGKGHLEARPASGDLPQARVRNPGDQRLAVGRIRQETRRHVDGETHAVGVSRQRQRCAGARVPEPYTLWPVGPGRQRPVIRR